MKRYVRSSNVDKLSFTFPDGVEGQLPEWYRYRTDEEIEEAKQTLINEYSTSRSQYDEDCEDGECDIDYKKISSQLRDSGYTPAERKEIIRRMQLGHTLDSAMQDIDMEGV